jgi:hypothetical protein
MVKLRVISIINKRSLLALIKKFRLMSKKSGGSLNTGWM